jgi:hypothetical protein
MFLAVSEILSLLSIATLLVGLFYVPSIKTGLNLADEGYLWYGTLQVLAGKIPIRDFRAYDPGRYYWSAIWLRLLGSNLLSLRIGLVIAQILSLSAGLAVIYLITDAWWPVIIMGFAMMSWMYPRHKQIDILFAMLTPLIALLLVDNPVASQYFCSGLYVAIALFFGLNHGVYAAGALLLLILILGANGAVPGLIQSGSLYALGLVVGMLPIIALFIFIPRLFTVYWQQKVSKILKRGTTNLPLKIPWLWQSGLLQFRQLDKTGQWLVKALFTIIPITYLIIILPVIFGYSLAVNHQWEMVAIACCGLCYWHHAMSRADLSHLAQAIAPFIMLLVILCAEYWLGWIAIVALILCTLKTIYLPSTGGAQSLLNNTGLIRFDVGGINLWLTPWQGNYLTRLRSLIERYSRPGDAVLLLPNLVTLYPLMQRQTVVYDLFCLYPATDLEQANMISELSVQAVGFALINNNPVDARDDLRFSQTHPSVWQYLNREFQLLEEQDVPPEHYVFVKEALS